MSIDPAFKREQLAKLREDIGRIMIGGKRPPAFTKAQREAVREKYDGHCAGCDDPLPSKGWHIDHIKAWADGGAHDLANWRAMCAGCHAQKTAVENSDRAKPNRLRKTLVEGKQASKRQIRSNPQIRSRNEWPKSQKLRSRNTFKKWSPV